MAIQINRGRQFQVGEASVQLFDGKGRAGSFLAKAAEKLTAQQVSVTLDSGGRAVKLTSADEWKAFLAEHCATNEQSAKFADKFGITFSDFVNVIDDAAAADDVGVQLDLSPTSELSKQLSLDTVDNDYGSKLAKDAKVNLTGAAGTLIEATAAGVPTITKDILAGATGGFSWDRDRTEQESWADFKIGDGASKKFKENTGPAPFAKLTDPKFDDADALALMEKFALPLHLEVSTSAPANPDGTKKFQDGSEMFRETYFEDRNGSLTKAGASVRARVRFDDDPPYTVNRVLVQAKEGRVVGNDRSAVHKFEKRWEGTSVTEESAKSQLVNGKDEGGQPLVVSQKLYKLAADKGSLPADGNLQLEPKYTVLQKRRRTHLQLDSVSQVQTRRTGLQTEIDKLKAAGTPVPDTMNRFAAKLDEQIKFLTDSGALLQKYSQYMPSGECFIISADRYSVYDPAARKADNPPIDIDDEVGRIGRGPLHVEAEWDSASSDGFEKAIAEIDKRLAATPPPANVDELKTDRAAIEAAREVFRKDVSQTVEVLKQRLQGAGLTEEPTKLSKEERASELGKNPNRPVFWL
jgi:hypothetical protein